LRSEEDRVQPASEDGEAPRTVSAVIGLVIDSASGSEVLTHLGGDVKIDGIQAGHGVAAAVHLDDLA
jgi:hypothetical protein